MTSNTKKQTDFLVIGTSIPGLMLAHYLSEIGTVTLVTKGRLKASYHYLHSSGLAAALSNEDDFDAHYQDTINSGAGLCKESSVRQVVFGAKKVFDCLSSLGLKFKASPLLESGHSKARTWISSEATGSDIFNLLAKLVSKNRSISILELSEVVELFVHEDVCKGAFVRSTQSNEANLEFIGAKKTILATGGLGQLFSHTSNTSGAAGDGLALAVHAGLELSQLEFVQFHPTAFAFSEESFYHIIPESIRGMGAKIVDQNGEAFMSRFDERGDLAQKDLVSRAVHVERHHGPVYLDMRMIDHTQLKNNYANLLAYLKKHQLNPQLDLIPIIPVADFACGGIPVDLKGATQLPGLYALGEVANTGLHGANALASNALLEGLVYARVIADAIKSVNHLRLELPEEILSPSVAIEDLNQIKAYGFRIAKIMSENVGLIRTEESLSRAKKEIVSIPARDYRVQYRQLVCYKMIEACQKRQTSIGSHYIGNEII